MAAGNTFLLAGDLPRAEHAFQESLAQHEDPLRPVGGDCPPRAGLAITSLLAGDAELAASRARRLVELGELS
ncbi:hypothetical protein, partial [Crossiella equi]|uniref:hypothetical protein n=1 Tax=Crossiella equi TaxID=130796 RepID=UPI001178080E